VDGERWPNSSRRDAQHPRLSLISGRSPVGRAAEAVQTRLDLWLKTHIEKLLGRCSACPRPRTSPASAAASQFQLVEALGVLERTKIFAEMKDLDRRRARPLRTMTASARRLSHLRRF